jgi:membrane protease YdiL (CAAX protease family)
MKARASRIPALIGFGLVALVLTLLVGGFWSALLAVNLATSPAIPWSVVLMAALLWLMWQYLVGRWGPRSTSEARRRYLRARRVPGCVFAWSLVAGLLAIVSLSGLWIVLFQLFNLAGTRASTLPDYSKYPPLTVALVLVMASLVGAIAEEAGIRGYFQGSLEGSVGGVAAIAIAAVVIAPGHGLTQGFVPPTLLFYLCVDIMFGAMAYRTQSILPGIAVHTLGLLTFFTLVWPGDALRQTLGGGDASAWLWIHLAQTLVFAALATLAFSRLPRATKSLYARK